jgi:hypothetical protein
MVERVYVDPESKESQTEHIEAQLMELNSLVWSEVYCDLFALRIVISIYHFGLFSNHYSIGSFVNTVY